MHPQINIFHGVFLDSAFQQYINLIPEEKRPSVVSAELLTERIPLYRKEWESQGKTLLDAITSILELQFTSQKVGVFVVRNFWRAFSSPLVISAKYQPEAFVDVLTHELIHVLFSQNTEKIHYKRYISEVYPEITDKIACNHIILHAVHKKIYLEILKDESRLLQNYERNKEATSPGYKIAWEYVNAQDYNAIIHQFKTFYQQ